MSGPTIREPSYVPAFLAWAAGMERQHRKEERMKTETAAELSADPCHHCGAQPETEEDPTADPAKCDPWEIWCPECYDPEGKHGPDSGLSEDGAIDEWNCAQRWMQDEAEEKERNER